MIRLHATIRPRSKPFRNLLVRHLVCKLLLCQLLLHMKACKLIDPLQDGGLVSSGDHAHAAKARVLRHVSTELHIAVLCRR